MEEFQKMTITEVYEKYKHLDGAVEVMRKLGFAGVEQMMLADVWDAIKAEIPGPANCQRAYICPECKQPLFDKDSLPDTLSGERLHEKCLKNRMERGD